MRLQDYNLKMISFGQLFGWICLVSKLVLYSQYSNYLIGSFTVQSRMLANLMLEPRLRKKRNISFGSVFYLIQEIIEEFSFRGGLNLYYLSCAVKVQVLSILFSFNRRQTWVLELNEGFIELLRVSTRILEETFSNTLITKILSSFCLSTIFKNNKSREFMKQHKTQANF